MDQSIKKIYELLHSPIVTPHNLLENAKLENYKYVNYYKGENGLVAEMECSMDDGVDATFYYYFDVEDKLVRVLEEVKGKKSIVFDREEELETIKKAYITKRNESTSSKAV